MNKQELRKEMRNRKRQFTQTQLGELSLSVISQLRNHPRVKAAQVILLYYSLPDEVNTHEWIEELSKEGKKVLLPVVIDDKQMILREYNSKKDLREGSFHIMEPIGKLFPEEKYGEIEVGIIPGMSFDEKLNRLGRGKGYYDRLLEKIANSQSTSTTSKNIIKDHSIDNAMTRKEEEGYNITNNQTAPHALYKIGICFSFQKTEELPFNKHDIKMDEVIFSIGNIKS